ncbi:MAG: hypothetical protein EXS00_03515 [Phycisphaerales bacterium]|nr:hypothetical protein [Phycisphaerales bacterium]
MMLSSIERVLSPKYLFPTSIRKRIASSVSRMPHLPVTEAHPSTTRMPPRDGQLGFLSFPPLRVQGISVAGEQSVVIVPEFDVSFDIGLCPRSAISANLVALTHAHMDHVAALPYWFSQRFFQNMQPSVCLCHPELVEPLRAMMRSWVDLERQRTPHEIVGVSPDSDYRVRNNIYIKAIEVSHGVPALGYVLFERRAKLCDEFVGFPQEKLRELKLSGQEISRQLDVPLVAYTGDTEPGPFLFRPEFANARVVITECTFFEPEHRDRARTGKHIHVDDLCSLLRVWTAEHVVVTHISRRTMIPYARQCLDSLDGGAHRDRLHILMDHRGNRARLERFLSEGQGLTSDNHEDPPPVQPLGQKPE